jgi:hypothetical protein
VHGPYHWPRQARDARRRRLGSRRGSEERRGTGSNTALFLYSAASRHVLTVLVSDSEAQQL